MAEESSLGLATVEREGFFRTESLLQREREGGVAVAIYKCTGLALPGSNSSSSTQQSSSPRWAGNTIAV